MNKLLSLAAVVGIALMLPANVSAQCDPADLHEGHFAGYSAHAVSGAGAFAVGEAWSAYEVLNTTQVNPWYPWNQVAFEYTLVIQGMVSSSVDTPFPFPPAGQFVRDVGFSNVGWAIYADAGTPADPANIGTYIDGALILSGTISNMTASGLLGGTNPEVLGVHGTANITGGSAIGDVLCTTLLMNDFLAWGTAAGGTIPVGFKELYDSKWECCVVTSVESEPWGRVKGLYR